MKYDATWSFSIMMPSGQEEVEWFMMNTRRQVHAKTHQE